MPEQPRIGFAGTPEFARTILAALLAAGVHPVLVLSQPDRPSGRGRRLVASPVKTLASEYSLSIHQPVRLRTDDQVAPLIAAELDLLIVAAYGLLLPPRVLALPALGCVNVHASLLPRWRGAAPVEHAMLAGDAETGVCLMQMEAGLDTGPVLARHATTIRDDICGADLEAELAALGASLLVRCLPDVLAGRLQATPQDDTLACYAPKLSRADAVFDWRQPAVAIARRIRALSGRFTVTVASDAGRVQLLDATARAADAAAPAAAPGTMVSTGRVIEVATGDGILCIHRLRFVDRGKGAPLDAAAASNGFADAIHLGAQLVVDA